MSDETKDVQKVDETTAAPSTETKQPSNDEKKDDGLVPRHRLNEESKKRQDAESAAQAAQRAAEAATAKIDTLVKALGGADSKGEKDELVSSFASQWRVEEDFVKGLLDVVAKKTSTSQKIDPTVQQALAEVHFNNELETLMDEVEEASELTREQRKELKKRAFEMPRTPLKTIFRDMMYDKRAETRKTFEESRSGGKASADTGTPDFGKMSVEEWREWSSKNLNQKRRR